MDKSSEPLSKNNKQNMVTLDVDRRVKDDSFKSHTGDTEAQTDTAVTITRIEADKAKQKRRSDFDRWLLGVSSKFVQIGSQSSVDWQILKERSSEDSAIELERLQSDFAINFEREEKKKLFSDLIKHEREINDKSLVKEQAKSVLKAEASANLLSVEMAAHLDTKKALTTREEFVAIVSHDLRNPIGTIFSCAEILLDESSVNLNDDAKHWIELIKRSANSSLRLISDILDMERIVGGKLQLNLERCQISDLVKESVENNTHLASAKTILLRASPMSITGYITCDKARIEQVLSNLIGNAVKFTPEGGAVVITVEENEKEIKVSVNDTGPGIPENQIGRIFERFTQLENKNRTGLGLGLHISKTLIEFHQGKIGVTSSIGTGSTFYFTLPK